MSSIKQYEIRQAKADYSSLLGLDKAYLTDENGGNRKNLPVMNTISGALTWVYTRENPDRRWATGLDEESYVFEHLYDDPKLREQKRTDVTAHRERLEKLTGFKLDAALTNPFWRSFPIKLVQAAGNSVFKMNNPEHEIMLRSAIASGYVAPSEESLVEDQYMDCQYYLYNGTEKVTQKKESARSRARATASLQKHEGDKERLYAIGKTLGTYVDRGLSADALFDLLLEYVENSPVAKLDGVTEVLNADPKSLIVRIKVKEALERGGVFNYSQELKTHTFLGQKVGANEDLIVYFFEDVKNQDVFAALEDKLEELR